jgi:hypothetical protein
MSGAAARGALATRAGGPVECQWGQAATTATTRVGFVGAGNKKGHHARSCGVLHEPKDARRHGGRGAAHEVRGGSAGGNRDVRIADHELVGAGPYSRGTTLRRGVLELT